MHKDIVITEKGASSLTSLTAPELLAFKRHAKDDPKSEANGKDQEAPAETRRGENGMIKTNASSNGTTDAPTPVNNALDEQDKYQDKYKIKASHKHKDKPNYKASHMVKDKHIQKVNHKHSMEPQRHPYQKHRPRKRRSHTQPRNHRPRSRRISQSHHLPRKSTSAHSKRSDLLPDNSCPGNEETARMEKDQSRDRRDRATFGPRASARNHAHEVENIAHLPAKKKTTDGTGRQE